MTTRDVLSSSSSVFFSSMSVGQDNPSSSFWTLAVPSRSSLSKFSTLSNSTIWLLSRRGGGRFGSLGSDRSSALLLPSFVPSISGVDTTVSTIVASSTSTISASCPPSSLSSVAPSSAISSSYTFSIERPPSSSSSCTTNLPLLDDILAIKTSPSPGAAFLLSRSASNLRRSILCSSRSLKSAWRSRMRPSTFLRPVPRRWVVTFHIAFDDCAVSSSLFDGAPSPLARERDVFERFWSGDTQPPAVVAYSALAGVAVFCAAIDGRRCAAVSPHVAVPDLPARERDSRERSSKGPLPCEP
mmetsp:Transcript_1310/g.3288  ORF Transcript_1310/g.3288 Transcript_1310/m.3288 type:complete len:299 (+) Transcript_1310:468-1364(+)